MNIFICSFILGDIYWRLKKNIMKNIIETLYVLLPFKNLSGQFSVPKNTFLSIRKQKFRGEC